MEEIKQVMLLYKMMIAVWMVSWAAGENSLLSSSLDNFHSSIPITYINISYRERQNRPISQRNVDWGWMRMK
jgi:hypothetical protein